MFCSPGCNPHWNASMQFLVKDLQQDILCLTVFDRDFFSPNEFLGRSELRLADIIAGCEERRGPVTAWSKKILQAGCWIFKILHYLLWSFLGESNSLIWQKQTGNEDLETVGGRLWGSLCQSGHSALPIGLLLVSSRLRPDFQEIPDFKVFLSICSHLYCIQSTT